MRYFSVINRNMKKTTIKKLFLVLAVILLLHHSDNLCNGPTNFLQLKTVSKKDFTN